METKEMETIVQEVKTEVENNTLSSEHIDGENVAKTDVLDPTLEQDGKSSLSSLPSSSGEMKVNEETEKKEEIEEIKESKNSISMEDLELILSSIAENASETETLEAVEEVPKTLFNTPLEEYSVSDGLLLCILFILLANLINSIFKGSHWFGKL